MQLDANLIDGAIFTPQEYLADEAYTDLVYLSLLERAQSELIRWVLGE